MHGADDQFIALLVDEANARRLHVHQFADQFDGALQHAIQIARLGEHHGDGIDGRQFIDALAELELLIAKPRDGVGQQE